MTEALNAIPTVLVAVALIGSLVGNAVQWWRRDKSNERRIENLALRHEVEGLKRARRTLEANVRRAATEFEASRRDHARRLAFYRAQIDQCADPASRGAVALAAFRELLSDEADGDTAAP